MDLVKLATMGGVLADPSSVIQRSLRHKLRKFGAAVIYNFLETGARELLLREALDLRARSIRYSRFYNPYNDSRHTGPQTDATSFRSNFSLEICDRAQIPEGCIADRLFAQPEMTTAIRSITGKENLSHYNDPGAALNLTYMRSGDAVGWHFDTCDFVVALVLQMPATGGDLLFSCRNRSAQAESREHVFDTLIRPSALSLRIPYAEASLVIFEGRHSLHCIRPISGPKERIVLLMSYHETSESNVTDSLREGRYVASHGSTERR